jgi:hypothetical protein
MISTDVRTAVTFDRILLAADFSPSTDVALGYATGLARQLAAQDQRLKQVKVAQFRGNSKVVAFGNISLPFALAS